MAIEDSAIRLGKGLFMAMWGDKVDTVSHLSLTITKALAVSVAYESGTFGAESHRRAAKAAAAF